MTEITDHLDVIKEELGKKATDKRTKAYKAIKELETKLDYDEGKISDWLDKIIDETIKEFEGKNV